MRFFITGATGLVGRALIQDLVAEGHQVRALSRSGAGPAQEGVEWVKGDPGRAGDWQARISPTPGKNTSTSPAVSDNAVITA